MFNSTKHSRSWMLLLLTGIAVTHMSPVTEAQTAANQPAIRIFEKMEPETHSQLSISMFSSAPPALGLLASQTVVRPGPVMTNNSFYYIRSDRFHFSATVQNGKFTHNEIEKRARAVAAQERAVNSRSHVWDDLYYSKRLPQSGDQYLLVLWNNWDNSTNPVQWSAVKNSPAVWKVKTSDGKTFEPDNGEQVKLRFKVTKSNQILDIDIENPRNVGRFTEDDIWYGFGF